MLYMQEVERMDGYGEESYPAKVNMAQGLGLQNSSTESQKIVEKPRAVLLCKG